MTSENNVKILGNIEDREKSIVANNIAEMFIKKYPNIEAEVYLGYPSFLAA